MEISTVYRVKYFVKHPWEVTKHFKYFKNKDDAEAFLKVIYPKGYNNTSINCNPVIEDVAILSDGNNNYCLGSPIQILTEYTVPPESQSNSELPSRFSTPFGSSQVNF